MKAVALSLLSVVAATLLLVLSSPSYYISGALASAPMADCPSTVRLNEFLPYPAGDYKAEWIELYNKGGGSVDLTGWQLDDSVGGSDPYTVTSGTTIPSHGFVLFRRADTRIILSDKADEVRLLCPDGRLAESHGYSGPASGQSRSKTVDGGTTWTWDYPPSPGGPNRPATPTCSPTSSPTASPTPTRTPCPLATPTLTATTTTTTSPTASQTPTATAAGTVPPEPTASVTATVTPTPRPPMVFINEFLPAARDVDWDGSGLADWDDEWIELFNAGEESVDLRGWRLDDRGDGGTYPYTIPQGTILVPRGFGLFFKKDTNVGLNDGDDCVRLLRPDSSVADEMQYEGHPGYDQSFSRTVDGGGEWVGNWEVTPGEPNRPRAMVCCIELPLICRGCTQADGQDSARRRIRAPVVAPSR